MCIPRKLMSFTGGQCSGGTSARPQRFVVLSVGRHPSLRKHRSLRPSLHLVAKTHNGYLSIADNTNIMLYTMYSVLYIHGI